MPIWLRKYTFNSIKEFYDKEKEEYDKEVNKSKGFTNATTIPKTSPAITKPTYNTKASKK